MVNWPSVACACAYGGYDIATTWEIFLLSILRDSYSYTTAKVNAKCHRQPSCVAVLDTELHWLDGTQRVMSMVDSIKVLCPLFDKIKILIPVIAQALSHLWTKCEILIRYRNEEKMTIGTVYQT